MRTSKQVRMYLEIEKHGKNLLVIFPNAREKNPVSLSKKLFSLENKIHKSVTDYCNGDIDLEQIEEMKEKTLVKLFSILNPDKAQVKHIFINLDPRGYSLKLDNEYAKDVNIYRDWGGYGIIAPDFSYDC